METWRSSHPLSIATKLAQLPSLHTGIRDTSGLKQTTTLVDGQAARTRSPAT